MDVKKLSSIDENRGVRIGCNFAIAAVIAIIVLVLKLIDKLS